MVPGVAAVLDPSDYEHQLVEEGWLWSVSDDKVLLAGRTALEVVLLVHDLSLDGGHGMQNTDLHIPDIQVGLSAGELGIVV